MRAAVARVTLAVTSVVALTFLIPLGLLLRTQLRTEVTRDAELRAAAVAPALSLSTQPADLQADLGDAGGGDVLSVRLPDGRVVGDSHAPGQLLDRVGEVRRSVAADIPGGWDYLQPVLLGRQQVALVEEFVPQARLDRGVRTGWSELALLAVVLVAGSVLVVDRFAVRLARSARGLASAAHALGAGDLEVRVEPTGPAELSEAGRAFNAMADRVTQLMVAERELVADLSHRLRTPLTALYLAIEQLGSAAGVTRLTSATHQLEAEVDSIIRTARTPAATGHRAPDDRPGTAGLSPGPTGSSLRGGREGGREGDRCEVSEVVAHRVGFWSVLAAQQGRECRLGATDEPTPVPLLEDDLAALVDALVGNVFRHTRQGTPFAVSVRRTALSIVLVVEDGGPGIDDPAGALSRGVSVGGSTGLGLDIARRAAASAGGQVLIGRSSLGGARVEVVFGLAAEPRRRRPWRHRRR
ncbi:signal transduction histidine kinase [Kitasatospora sp. MAP12-15]|uniref:sensor histidine kinase n=1 Tax=unclassified Kitasatospora TaxID=2633591 RepID=UPI0024761855|nr:HAMP domain-containing sensor histidine kinase [Kitasatospora sp. MAP12-44]MDH6115118.1 signal transduction histidine kinase [Kitasatospora sp. MAP12-44]